MGTPFFNNAQVSESEQSHNANDLFSSNEYHKFDGIHAGAQGNAYGQNWSYPQEGLGGASDSLNFDWRENDGDIPSSLDFQTSNDPLVQPFAAAAESNIQNAGFGGGHSIPFPQNAYDPALLSLSHPDPPRKNLQHSQTNTISPEALQNNVASSFNQHQLSTRNERIQPASTLSAPAQKIFPAPKGTSSGIFLISSPESLQKATNSKRLHKFANICEKTVELPISKSTIPVYNPRKSRNELNRPLSAVERLRAEAVRKKYQKSAATASRPGLSSLKTRDQSLVKQEEELESSSEEDSSDESEYESSSAEEEEPKPPIPAARPTAPKDAVRYDTIKSLWRPATPNQAMGEQSIRQGMNEFFEVVNTIGDRWKADCEDVKKAQDQNESRQVPVFKQRVVDQRELMEVAMDAALGHGYPEIIEYFGQHLKLLALLNRFLRDRVQESDWNGDLSRAILRFLSKCTRMTHGTLEKVQLGKLVPRFAKRGDDEVKTLASKINSNALAASKKQKAESSSYSSSSKDATASSAAGVKRARPNDQTAEQPFKKLSTQRSNANAGQSKTTVTPKQPSTPGVAAKFTSTATRPTGVKQKTNQVVAKPTGYFSALQAIKKPGTSIAASSSSSAQSRATQRSPTDTKSSTPASSSASAKPAFSFSETLANISRGPQKPEAAAKPNEETSKGPVEEKEVDKKREERLARLKARGNPRVSFKPQHELVDIHYLEHDAEEDLGHDESQTRDVDSVRSEGAMFKQLKMQMDEAEMDPIDDLSSRFDPPELVNFSEVDREHRNICFFPYCDSTRQPDCPEKAAQEQRESVTLVAVYTDPKDIPPSPKEPISDAEDPMDVTYDLGEPPPKVKDRIESVKSKEQEQARVPSSNDLAAILASLTQPQNPFQSFQSGQMDQGPSQNSGQNSGPNPMTELEKLFAQAPSSNQSFQPPGSANVAGDGQWAPENQMDLHPPPMPPMNSVSGPPNATDLAAFIASMDQMNAAQSNQQPPPIPFPPPPEFFQAMQESMQQPFNPMMPFMQPDQQLNTQRQPYENEERKRYREGGYRQYEPRPVKNDKKFTQTCKYWKEGKCRKGNDCTYRHDYELEK